MVRQADSEEAINQRLKAADIRLRVVGGFGRSIHPVGIEQILLKDGEGFEALYV
jgi:hypothetical protein